MKHVHLVFIGHRDHGKSSILGRLFYDTKNISEQEMERIRIKANQLGRQGYEFAFVMDQIKEERMRGITIGLAHKKLQAEDVSFTFADAPGHKDFIKNMLIGASEADAAALVVAADEGIKEQTREHLFLSKMLGVPKIIIAVNKMDAINFDSNKFAQLKSEIERLIKNAGYKLNEVPIIPCSALDGENIVSKTNKMNWFSGATLFETFKNLDEKETPSYLPLRLPVQDIYETDRGKLIGGKISSGTVKTGDEIVVSSRENRLIKIEKIFIHDKEAEEAEPGDNVCVKLQTPNFKSQTSDSEFPIKRGDIIGAPDNPPTITNRFTAQIIVLNYPAGIKRGSESVFEMMPQIMPCKITKIIKKIDTTSGKNLGAAQEIKDGESGIVEIETEKPICVETQQDIPQLAGFRLIDDEKRVGMGICIKII